VRILGADHLAASVPQHASTALASNIFHLVAHLWNPETGFASDPGDEIARAAIVTRGGAIIHERVRQALASLSNPTPP
jgi:NAD(P) transhydrogenase subunit alpha